MKIFTVYVRFLCINKHNLVDQLTVVLQKVSMLLVLFNLSATIVAIPRVEFCLKVLLRVKDLTFRNFVIVFEV